ncbi:hypothetical protein Ahy_A02g006700 [Arachis hypogaea]|uniref:RNase H type-1 domain-containing protein n=1 Tax=Arachis hypogaea TaxID=3818 RepID=A0A445EAP4_ARAHY|nr:hypothetical protein Ahy_A02g006700 [Arachis hypogaea]
MRQINREGKEAKETMINKLGYLSWEIWKSRNYAIFRNISTEPMATITRARILEIEFMEANKIDEQKQPITNKRNSIENKNSYRRRVTWRLPIGDRLKMNVDGAFRKESGEGAIAVVIRDKVGNLVAGSAEIVRATSSLTVESMALRSALILAKNLQLENILFESDSLPLIQAVKAKETVGEIDPILRDIYVLVEGISNSGFTWTHREGNQLAHQVANLVINGKLN